MSRSNLGLTNKAKPTAKYTLYILSIFFFSLSASAQGDPEVGETVFNNVCATCHYPTEEINVGPGLKGVTERWKDKDLLYTWIKNPKQAEATGDPYVRDLLKDYRSRGIPDMVAQPVNDAQIDDVIAYIEAFKPPEDPTTVATGGPVCPEDTSTSWIWLIILCLIFLAVILSVSGVKKTLGNKKREEEGLEPIPVKSYGESFGNWAWKNKSMLSVIGIFCVMWMVSWLYGLGMNDVGVYGGKEGDVSSPDMTNVDFLCEDENYRPEQPIKFSHALHAGKNEIECVYCHSTANKSKTPSIPSTNVCMNCHVAIGKGPTTGEDEIQKIYDAIGFDRETKQYKKDYDVKPVEWVKVHDLPDHVYFNHSQHVKVAGLECETCHGDVKKMEVVEQVAPLTMGWCIQCHNETEVQTQDNGYYDEIHKRLVNHENGRALLREYKADQTITAREFGGWECSKCHY